MMKRCLSLLLVLPLILALAAPAHAVSDAWLELLEYSTVNGAGNNLFTFTDETTIQLDVPQYSRLQYIDMLFTVTSGKAPTSAAVIFGSSTFSLTIAQIDATTVRVFGPITGLYEDVNIRFQLSGTASYHLLSCKVKYLSEDTYTSDADIYFRTGDLSLEGIWEQSSTIDVEGDYDLTSAMMVSYIGRVEVYDWYKYDSVTVWGSVTMASINSVRASVGTTTLPMETNFIDGSDGTTITAHENYDIGLDGQYLYSVTVDLSGIDREDIASPMYIYFTGEYNTAYGMLFTFQYVTGSVEAADTSGSTWWDRFTSFMTDLFGGDDPDADDFASDMESQASEAGDLMDDLDSVTKPPVEDIEVDLSGIVSNDDVTKLTYPFTALLSNDLFLSMTLISLTLALVAYALYGKR